MDFLKSIASDGGDKPSEGGDKKIGKHSSTELLASAKTVADAAKTAAGGGMEKVDKEKAAGAASDLLGAGSDYGKLAEKGYGKYVDQAQDYLHQFGGKPTASAPTPAPAADPPKLAAEEEKPAAAPPAEHQGDDEKKKNEEKSDGGGIGGFVKTAQGFF